MAGNFAPQYNNTGVREREPLQEKQPSPSADEPIPLPSNWQRTPPEPVTFEDFSSDFSEPATSQDFSSDFSEPVTTENSLSNFPGTSSQRLSTAHRSRFGARKASAKLTVVVIGLLSIITILIATYLSKWQKAKGAEKEAPRTAEGSVEKTDGVNMEDVKSFVRSNLSKLGPEIFKDLSSDERTQLKEDPRHFINDVLQENPEYLDQFVTKNDVFRNVAVDIAVTYFTN